MEKTRILVWDVPVRIVHWLLAISFTGAFVTAESERWRDVHARRGVPRVGAKHKQPFLEAAEVLHPRDDFLPGIAALFEVDAAEQVPVGGLRDEQVRRRRRDHRHAGRDAEPAPRVGIGDRRVARKRGMLLKVFSIFVPGALSRVVMGGDEGTLVHC